MQKVSLYIRHNNSRKYEKVSAKASFGKGAFPPGTIFVLRYVRDGKRVFETLRGLPRPGLQRPPAATATHCSSSIGRSGTNR